MSEQGPPGNDPKELTLDNLRETLVDAVLECDRSDLIAALGQEEFDSQAKQGREIVQEALRKAKLS